MSSNMAEVSGRMPRLRDELAVGLHLGLGDEVGMHDVEDIAEVMGDADAGQDLLGMGHGPVGEDQLASGQRMQGVVQGLVGRHRRMIDVMHIVEEIIRSDAMLGHQAAQRGAVFVEHLLLAPLGFGMVDIRAAARRSLPS